MESDELERLRDTHPGWVPPRIVSLLVENGHLDVVRRLAVDGDWYCASAAAEELIARDCRDEALAILVPFVETGWWGAARVAALLAEWERAGEAEVLVRPWADAGERPAMAVRVRLLRQAGRAGEAFSLLRDHVGDARIAETLVDVTDGLGRDEEVAVLLAPYAASRSTSWGAPLLAAVLERQGLVDQAIAVLSGMASSLDVLESLVGLLARHGRVDEIRDLVDRGNKWAASFWARRLEDAGDVEGAIALLGPLALMEVTPPPVPGRCSEHLGGLLVRHGRWDEAIEVLLPALREDGYECGHVLAFLCTALVGQGCVDGALDVIASVPSNEDNEWALFRQRIVVLSDGGRSDRAITELRAHPEAATWYGAWVLADLLAAAERLDEALEVLMPTRLDNASTIAELKIRQGRVEEALDVLSDSDGLLPAYEDDLWVKARSRRL